MWGGKKNINYYHLKFNKQFINKDIYEIIVLDVLFD
jgi:hypothetical protein